MRSLLLGLLLLCLAISALAGPPMAKVTIHVTSADNGKPLDRASIVVRFVKGRAAAKLYSKILTTWETRTNQEGNAVLPSIPQGTIRVQVIAPNFQTFGQMLEVDEPAKTLEVKLNPPQPQYTVK